MSLDLSPSKSLQQGIPDSLISDKGKTLPKASNVMPLFDITESEIPGGRDLAHNSRDKTANQSVRNPNEHDMK